MAREFQVAHNMFEKKGYETVFTDNILESVRGLAIDAPANATQEAIDALYAGGMCFIKQAKKYSPYLFPYSMKTTGAKLVKENTKEFTMLVLDIDNGTKDGKCSIKEFMSKYTEFDYYLYTTVGHACSTVDRFRVIIPLEDPMEVEELILRKKAIEAMFSFGGFSFVDTSAINRCRGFVVPVKLGKFYECIHEVGSKLNVEKLDRARKVIRGEEIKRTVIEGVESHPEVLALANLYINSGKDDIILVNGKEYGRNDAFFWIHVEIAAYNPSLDAQVLIGKEMDWERLRGDSVVKNARKYCDKISKVALQLGSGCATNIVLDKYISKDMLQLDYRKINLLTSPPGTGKTTVILGSDLPIIEGIKHKVLFAAPLNSIVMQQAEKDSRIVSLTGNVGELPTADRIVCSFDALASILDKNPNMKDYLICVDECHKIIIEGYRASTMSRVVEHSIKGGGCTYLYMSGTFDPIFLECVKFTKHFNFSTKRPFRDVSVIVVDNAVQGAVKLLRKLEGTSLVLLDNIKKGEDAAKALGFAHIHKDSKDTPEYTKLIKESKLDRSTITTQVILEGLDVKDCIDNIVVVGKPDRWGVDQMVQFFERERVRTPNFYFVRTKIEVKDIVIKHAKTEKAYQNEAYRILNDQGLERMKDLGVMDTGKLFRSVSDSWDESIVEMNVVYAYIMQKRSFNQAMYQDMDAMSEEFRKHRYNMIDIEVPGVNGKDTKFTSIMETRKAMEIEDYNKLIDNSITGIDPEDPEDILTYKLVRNLVEVQEMNISQVLDIMHTAEKRNSYEGRIKYDRPEYERKMFKAFKPGDKYTLAEVNSKVLRALGAEWTSNLRLAKGSVVKLLKRYFEVKYSRVHKTHKIVKKINIIKSETWADL